MKILIILIAILVVGGGIFAATQLGDDTDTNTNTESTSTTDTSSDSGSSAMQSIQDLVRAGKDVMCTYDYEDEFAYQEGTVYISGNDVRGDFELTQNGETMASSTINDGTWSYVWGDALEGQGTKIRVDAAEDAMNTNAEDAEQSDAVDFDEDFEFDCDPWNRESSKFDLPSGVTFTDLSATMQQIEDVTSGVMETQCATCDALPEGAARDACRSGLGC